MLSLLLAVALVQDDAPYRSPRVTPEVLVVREVAPAVVYIESTRRVIVSEHPFGLGRQRVVEQTTSGSGVVVDKSGYIVTNYHVVQDDPLRITVQFDLAVDPQVYDAQLVSSAPGDDLALLKVDVGRDLPVVRRGTSSDLELGERVVAIGNPLGQRRTVSAGIISGLHRNLKIGSGQVQREFKELIQTDAAINPGNSGGPLLNILGELIGINTAVNESAENMGFAIPVDRVEEVLRDQLLAPSSSRAWFGFDVEESGTLCINRVVPDSPAAREGMDVGYRLLAINGKPITTTDDYRLQRLALLPNQPVRFRVKLAEGERDFVVRGWDRVSGTTFERTGMTVERFGVGRNLFVRVNYVSKVGPASRLGLKPGDIIDAVRVVENGTIWRVVDETQMAALLSGLSPDAALDLDILRDENRDGTLSVRDELFKGTLTLR